jgi:hypothetical protein
LASSPAAPGALVPRRWPRNFIVQHLRLRPGTFGDPDGGGDGLRLHHASNGILDHLSIGNATDEAVQISFTSDVTLQRSLFTETLGEHAEFGGMLLNYADPARGYFVELYNRGSQPIDVSTFSIQYASAGGNSWSRVNLTGSVQPGGYYLIQLAGGNTGADLPTPDLSSAAINMSATAGKLALVNNQNNLTGACPLGPSVLDFVGFGPAATCWEGTAPTPSPSISLSVQRAQNGCVDLNQNSGEFTTGTPAPRNSASAAAVCACIVHNESGAGLEADFCNVQFPTSLVLTTATLSPQVFGRIFEAGITEAAGPNAQVRAQLGFGLPTQNPQYGAWTWVNASFNVQIGNDDEYQATFTAPAPGSYRYAYRVSLDQGVSWTVCDPNGAGANPDLSLDLGNLPVLTVTP